MDITRLYAGLIAGRFQARFFPGGQKVFASVYAAILLMGFGVQAAGQVVEPSSGALAQIDQLILQPAFWSMADRDLAGELPAGVFRWVSEQRDSIRAGPGSPVRFADHKPVETVFRFTDGRVSQLFLVFFNRGDSGEVDEAAYRLQVEALTKLLSGMTGMPGRDVTARGAVTTARASHARVWNNAANTFRMEHAFTRQRLEGTTQTHFMPEFITLTILPPAQSDIQAAGAGEARIGVLALMGRVQKNSEGDVILQEVPMVDQGQKGYCAVAAVERVLRYYGIDFNQHLLAQRAMTETGGGTDPDSLLRALRVMCPDMRIRVNVISQFDVRDLRQVVNDYNREARRQRLPLIPWPPSGPVDLTELYRSMDRDAYRAARKPNQFAMRRFEDSIRSKIDMGYPVLWSVMLGLVEETPALPQEYGGHLRLIIGYNSRTGELFYTDSWGAGHEQKKMSCEDAQAITMSLFTLEPR